jgi:hypothetical protein
MRESIIEKYLVTQCKAKGWLCYKFSSPGHRGVPDRIILQPDGVVRFVELKAPGKKPIGLQLRTHERFAKFGSPVDVIDSKEGVDAWVGAI